MDHEPATEDTSLPLSDVEVAVLGFAKLHFAHLGTKEAEIRERFGWSMTRYYQVLNALLDSPHALAHDPLTVNRLRRLRAARRTSRTRTT